VNVPCDEEGVQFFVPHFTFPPKRLLLLYVQTFEAGGEGDTEHVILDCRVLGYTTSDLKVVLEVAPPGTYI
jgi:hypothetical protein